MKILYIADAQIPSRATHSLQIMRMCSAFVTAGADVALAYPRYTRLAPEHFDGDIWKFYGINRRFSMKILRTHLSPRLQRWNATARPLKAFPFATYLVDRVLREPTPFVIYTRSLLAAYIANRIRGWPLAARKISGVFLELHGVPNHAGYESMLRSLSGLIVISQALRDDLRARYPLPPDMALVAHDAAELEVIDRERASRETTRAELDVSHGQTLIVYAGRLMTSKGAATMLQCAQAIHRDDVRFLLVGKIYEQELAQKAAAIGKRVHLTGYVPPSWVPRYLAAADVALLPSTSSLSYVDHMSPLKLFEYMAAGTAIVASDLPVIREVLRDGENALLVEPENIGAWKEVITRLLDNPSLRSKLQANARRDVDAFTWNQRAVNIVNFIRERLAIRPALAATDDLGRDSNPS